MPRSFCDDVQFSPEDAGRSDPEFLYLVLGEAIKAGATTLNIPDTVGYTTPDEFGAMIAGIMKNTPGIENVTVAVHCHDDLGLATANTLAGIQAGARQAEVTMNGIGERAGNTSLEEIAMTLYTRRTIFGLETGIDTTQIFTNQPDGLQLHRVSPSNPIKPSSVRTLLPMKPVSTRTVCSRTRPHTRSCSPKLWVYTAPRWSWESIPVDTHLQRTPGRIGIRSG